MYAGSILIWLPKPTFVTSTSHTRGGLVTLHDVKYHDISIVEVASAAEKYTMTTIGRKSKVPLVDLAHVVNILEECL